MALLLIQIERNEENEDEDEDERSAQRRRQRYNKGGEEVVGQTRERKKEEEREGREARTRVTFVPLYSHYPPVRVGCRRQFFSLFYDVILRVLSYSGPPVYSTYEALCCARQGPMGVMQTVR